MQTIDFLPEHYKVSRQRRQAHYYRLGAVGAIVLVIGVSTYAVQWQKQQVRSQLQQLKVSKNAAGPQNARLAKMTDACLQLERKVTLVKLLECEPKVSTILAAVANCTPRGTRITRLSVTKNSDASLLVSSRTTRRSRRASKKKAAKKVDDVQRLQRRLQTQRIEVAIEGLALSNVQVVRFVSQLKACPLVSRAVLVVSSPRMDAEEQATEFEIRCELVSPASIAATRTGV